MPDGSPLIRRVAIGTGLAAFLYQFENCLTTTALPVMVWDVANLAGVISLVPAAYLVAALTAMVPAGRLAARAGHRLVLAAAIGLMAAGSLICALAPSLLPLLAGRLLQGLGGGAMASAAYGLVAVAVPSAERQRVLGWISLGAGLGMVAGTPLGGLVAATISWRALFALQVPLLLAVALSLWRMDFGRPAPAQVSLGLARSLFLGTGAAFACLAGSLGRDWGWGSPAIAAFVLSAVAVLTGFVWNEQRAATPLFPRDVWRARVFWPCWGLLFACAAALGGTFFLTPFYLHEDVLLPAPVAARWMVIQVACYSLAALNARRLQKMLAAEYQALLGVFLALAGALLFATGAALSAGNPGIALACALTGGGLGVIFPAVNAGCVARLPEAHRGLGAALLPLGINLGSMAGTIATAEIREWSRLHGAAGSVYLHAFLVVICFLAVAGVGFWREAPPRTP